MHNQGGHENAHDTRLKHGRTQCMTSAHPQNLKK
jgi:hypothetical protein